MSLPGFGRVEREAVVRGAIQRAAHRVGVDFSYLLNQARSESGLNPDARASSSTAGGLFQFIDQSWLGAVKLYGARHGLGWAADAIRRGRDGSWSVDGALRDRVMALRRDPEASALMAAEFASDNAEGLQNALGRQPRAADLYFAHFLGLAGATRFLKATEAQPGASAAALFPREASANRSIFYDKNGQARSLSQVYALMARKIDDDGVGVPVRAADPAAASAGFQLAEAREALRGDALDGGDEKNGATAHGMADMLALRRPGSALALLKPTPATARVAYLMLASDGDATIGDTARDA